MKILYTLGRHNFIHFYAGNKKLATYYIEDIEVYNMANPAFYDNVCETEYKALVCDYLKIVGFKIREN